MATVLEFPQKSKRIVMTTHIALPVRLHAQLQAEANERDIKLEDYLGRLMEEYCSQPDQAG